MKRIFSFLSTSAVVRSREPTCLFLSSLLLARSRSWTKASDGSSTWIQTRRERLRAAETRAVKSLRPLHGFQIAS